MEELQTVGKVILIIGVLKTVYLVGEVSPETLLKSRRLKVQGYDKTVPVDPTQEYVQFTVDLEQGEAELQTWFTLDTEDTLGAYFVSLEKL